MFSFVRPFLIALGAAAAAAAVPVAAGAAPVGPYAGLCASGKPAVLARVSGFKTPRGTLSVKLYPSNANSFLEKGRYIRKVEVAVNRAGPVDVCVPVPSAGRYALAVRHEVGAKKSRSDGGGFSGNPQVSLLDVALSRKPALNKVSFHVNGSTRLVPITLKYLQGGSIRPVS
jgi:uncharacterized protein (DUF2141 family)